MSDTSTNMSTTDVVLERQTIPHFVEFLLSGILPDNRMTSLALPSAQEVTGYMSRDYSLWGGGSHRDLQGSPRNRIMKLLDSYQNPTGLMFIDVNLDIAKSKIWERITPVSDSRWLSKRLDDQLHIDDAMTYIRMTISVFDYLHAAAVQGRLRDTYNLIYEELGIFEEALNSVRGERREAPVVITALWAEFMSAHFESMVQHARAWIFKRLRSLRAVWKRRIADAYVSGHRLNGTQLAVRIDHVGLSVYEKLLQLAIKADQNVRIPTYGFLGLSPPGECQLAPEDLWNIYLEEKAQLKAEKSSLLNLAIQSEITARRSRVQMELPALDEELPAHTEQLLVFFDRENAHIHVQPEVGEPPGQPGPEPWILGLQAELGRVDEFGFVLYRITYQENDSEWEAFMMKLYAGMNTWSGFAGSEEIRSEATLQYIDGRMENIPEGDLEAVGRHFFDMSPTARVRPGMHRTICLAVDASCLRSFRARSGTGPEADFRGFVVALDPGYDPGGPLDPWYDAEGGPNYPGHVRILDQCLLTDLLPLLRSRAYSLYEIWLAAAEHPWGVYVGLSAPAERERWEELSLELLSESRGG